MSEFDDKLGAILGDADAMGRIMELAQSLSAPKPVGEGEVPAQSMEETGRDVRLLSALRPYLKGPREQRLDEAVRLLRLTKLLPLLQEQGILTGTGGNSHGG